MLHKIAIPVLLFGVMLLSACWSRKQQFETRVVNHSGVALHSIEVDYPGGTYGITNIPAGGLNQKWVFTSGPCQYSIRFVDERGNQYKPKPIDISKESCPPGITLTIDSGMNVSAVATPK